MPPPFVRPFHFWCQKVLPLVFDDSLSYYEVLAKMRDYLNEAIKEINDIGSEFDGVKTQLTELKTYVDEYFAGLDVNQAISDKLDDMVESGEMDAVITPIFAAYANPLFAASVADMVATNFAYANYENNKIYTFNQSTGLYQTTGKEFGGVVSSVDEMEDNDKYYALDSDGMLYSYDFPQDAFVASGLTYGGYRYGVNAMRPISNVYVLTTNSHVYTWNGNEYVDTGVVYGLSNIAFVWRRKLSSEDNLTLLITDGWYSFESDNLPSGLPVNMETSDGFAIVYSIPNDTDDSDNLQNQASQDVQTQRTQTIRADSRNKRIILQTNNGGSWFWNGLTWISNSENGFPLCGNCDSVSWNSVCCCNNETINTPIPGNGMLKTFVCGNSKSQLFFNSENVWFRHDNAQWVRIVRNDEQISNTQNINALYNAIYELSDYQSETRFAVINGLNSVNDRINFLSYTFGRVEEAVLSCENYIAIQTENNSTITAAKLVQKTDKDLNQLSVPADGYYTGLAIEQVKEEIDDNKTQINNAMSLLDEKIENCETRISSTYGAITETYNSQLLSERSETITSENNEVILSLHLGISTDETLTQYDMAANAKATGDIINTVRLTAVNAETNSINNGVEIEQIKNETLETQEFGISTTENNSIVTENGNVIIALLVKLKIDATLTESGVPADSKTVGESIDSLSTPQYLDELRYITGTGMNEPYPIIRVDILGDLPLTKTNVNVHVKITNGNEVVINAMAQLKVQGSSSLNNPEKNYTLTLDNNITLIGLTTNKWNLKCNYIDPTQIRNLLGANLWFRMNADLNNARNTSNTTTQSNNIIVSENNDAIQNESIAIEIAKSPYFGVSKGKLCFVTHNGKFHGVYTIQIPKGYYLLGMRESKPNQFIVTSDRWDFSPKTSYTELRDIVSIEEKSNNIEDDYIYEKLNAWATNIQNATSIEEMTFTNTTIAIRYAIFARYIYHFDGISRNIILYSTDGGNSINLSPWDMDCTFGNDYTPVSLPRSPLSQLTVTRNALLNKVIELSGQNINLIQDSMKQHLNQGVIWSELSSLLSGFPYSLFELDFRKWHTKGKTLFCTPTELLAWNIVHEPIANMPIIGG